MITRFFIINIKDINEYFYVLRNFCGYENVITSLSPTVMGNFSET